MNTKELLDRFYPNRHKCQCCGGEILYKNFHISKTGRITGTSFNTSKICGDKTYFLHTCENCIISKFSIKNISRTYNVMSEITKFAFNIPDDVYKASRSKYAMTKDAMIAKYGEQGVLRNGMSIARSRHLQIHLNISIKNMTGPRNSLMSIINHVL